MADTQTSPYRERVAGRDRVWLQDSPLNLMVINSVFTLDRMDRETLRDLWFDRVIAASGERHARFVRRIVFEGRHAYWQDDPDFDIDRHVILAPPIVGDRQALATREKLQEYVGSQASEPLPGDRPLWQIQVVPDYRDGMTAVVFRIHHVIADGISLVPVLFSLIDPETGEEPSIQQVAKKASPWAPVAAALAGPFMLAQKFIWRADRSVVHGAPLSGRKRVAWTDPIEVDLIKKVKNAFGATVNDVLMACLSGAFERYVESHPGSGMETFRVSMPVNIRPLGEEPRLENKFAAVMLDLPVGLKDIRERVLATKKRLDSLKRSPEPLFTYGTVRLMLATLPAGVSRGLINHLANKCTCVASNVPGPRTPVYVDGRRLRAIMFWVPQRADIGIGVSMMSFAGHLTVGVICDTEVVTDPRGLIAAFEREFRNLRNAVDL